MEGRDAHWTGYQRPSGHCIQPGPGPSGRACTMSGMAYCEPCSVSQRLRHAWLTLACTGVLLWRSGHCKPHHIHPGLLLGLLLGNEITAPFCFFLACCREHPSSDIACLPSATWHMKKFLILPISQNCMEESSMH